MTSCEAGLLSALTSLFWKLRLFLSHRSQLLRLLNCGVLRGGFLSANQSTMLIASADFDMAQNNGTSSVAAYNMSVAQQTSETGLDPVANLLETITQNSKSFSSPIDLNLGRMVPVQLVQLSWPLYETVTKKVKISNSGHTLIVTAKWTNQEFPHLTGGPFSSPFIFSQLHFHWGATDLEGSEHTFDGVKYPLEMHVVHYNEDYGSLNHALKQKNGVAIVVYVFQLQNQPNNDIQFILNGIPHVRSSQTSWRAENVVLNNLIRPFTEDYFLYWGTLETAQMMHDVLWIISRTPMGVSYKQMQAFRTLLDANEDLQLRNFRQTCEIPPNADVYHVNPGKQTYSSLLPIEEAKIEPRSGGNLR